MPESDPDELADQLEAETDRLQQEADRLGQEVASAREVWEHKRADPSVPGAAPKDGAESGGPQPKSPAPQAPPPEEGPSASESAPELEVGPPADTGGEPA